jgi:hypothetical protein
VVAILVASAAVWLILIAVVATLFFAVFIPGVQFGGRAEIPSDFPIYPGAHLDSAFATRAGGCTTVEAEWSTGDDATRVVAFYREQLSTGDWTLTDSTRSGSATVLDFKSSSGASPNGYLSVESTPYSSTTRIMMTVTKATSANTECHVLGGVVD